MKLFILSNEEIALLEYEHKHTRDGLVRDRIKSVILYAKGWSAKKIAEALLIHETTVYEHLNDYQNSNKLKPENGGSEGYLNEEQTKVLDQYLIDYIQQKQQDIVELVFNMFGIRFSISGMTKWLKRNGFSYKQPTPIPHKFCASAQEVFKKEYYYLKDTISEGEHILFIDAVHPTQATKLSHGWIKSGKDKAIRTTGSRTRVSLVGAIELNDISNAVVNEYETVNGETIVEFLKDIRAKYLSEGKLHIILDGAGYHKSHHVREAAVNLNIKLHFLPPYSPNLNPIERLWKVMNEHVRNNRYFPTKQDFRNSILRFFRDILPKIGNTLSSRINDNFQTLKLGS